MAKTKYATAQDEAQIRETLGIMTRRLNRIRDGAFPGYNTWGAAKEVITFLVVNGHDHAAAKVARDFAAGRQTFVDDRVGGEAAQSNWSNRVTRRDMFKGIHELNDAPKVGGLVHDGFGGASAAGGPLSAAFHGVAASLGAGRGMYAGNPPPRFEVGDRVMDVDGGRVGTIDYGPANYQGEEYGGWQWKVQEDDGPRMWRNDRSLVPAR